jgi:hypothetical protein
MIETHTFDNGVQVIVTDNGIRIDSGNDLAISHPDFSISNGDVFSAIVFALTPKKEIYVSMEP